MSSEARKFSETTWSGAKFDGTVERGWYETEGTYTYANGTVYKGQFRHSEFHGKGKLIFPEGGEYVGVWQRGTAVEGK